MGLDGIAGGIRPGTLDAEGIHGVAGNFVVAEAHGFEADSLTHHLDGSDPLQEHGEWS